MCFQNSKSDQIIWDLGGVRPPAKLLFGGLDYPILGMDQISTEACPGMSNINKANLTKISEPFVWSGTF